MTHTERVLSGMRPTGQLHLGHYHGVLKNWIHLQNQYECYFFVADWHALTTHYDDPKSIDQHIWDMVIDWLASGVDPEKATLFLQSRVPEHAELFLLLSMGTPLSWLERVPTYKDQIEKLKEKDLSTYGFLGYPLLQAADILIYRAQYVPVGEDQVPHVEITREISRRFNYLYGKDKSTEQITQSIISQLSPVRIEAIETARRIYQETGQQEAIDRVYKQLQRGSLSPENLSLIRDHLFSRRRTILPEPSALLTPASKMPGLDGQKMSKSYQNTITLRESPELVSQKIKKMPTDPARMKRSDPGNPDKCPVWQLHQIYTDDSCHAWVQSGCQTAKIGCLDCKQPVIDAIIVEQQPIFERAQKYLGQPQLVRDIIDDGSAKARQTAQETMCEVRESMGLLPSKSSCRTH